MHAAERPGVDLLFQTGDVRVGATLAVARKNGTMYQIAHKGTGLNTCGPSRIASKTAGDREGRPYAGIR